MGDYTNITINGNVLSYIGNDGIRVPINFPNTFSVGNLQDQINAAAFFASKGPDAAQWFLAVNFIWGGTGDLQRPDGAAGPMNGDMQAAAAYLYGAACAAANLSIDEALGAAGDLAYLSTNRNPNNEYGLPDGRQAQIEAGFGDVKTGLISPDGTTTAATISDIASADMDMWRQACDNSFTYNLALMAAALKKATGGDLLNERRTTHVQHQEEPAR